MSSTVEGTSMRRQRVVGLIGCPGSGKSTYARRFDPRDGWVHLTLDDLRQALWPPDRQMYWEVRRGPYDGAARSLLHRVKEEALEVALTQGFSVVMPDTHLTREVFARELEIIEAHGLAVEWKLFEVPWEVLVARNEERGRIDPAHRQPEAVLRLTYEAFHAPDAWWKAVPVDQLEIIAG
jgi:predicted kinase